MRSRTGCQVCAHSEATILHILVQFPVPTCEVMSNSYCRVGVGAVCRPTPHWWLPNLLILLGTANELYCVWLLGWKLLSVRWRWIAWGLRPSSLVRVHIQFFKSQLKMKVKVESGVLHQSEFTAGWINVAKITKVDDTIAQCRTMSHRQVAEKSIFPWDLGSFWMVGLLDNFWMSSCKWKILSALIF